MIALLGFNDLHLMQFLYKYTNILDAQGMDYDVIYWNRSGSPGEKRFAGRAIPFEEPLDTYMPFRKKIGGFLRYARFMRRQIQAGAYDCLIVLTTQTAIPLYDVLTRAYRGRYWYDYRDLTRENRFAFYRRMVRLLIQRSYKTAMSSMGFLPALGVPRSDRIVMAHNTQTICEKAACRCRIGGHFPIRLVYWGMIRQPDFHFGVCKQFGRDERFAVTYHGEGYAQELERRCRQAYVSAGFTGRYEPGEIPSFARETDILNCLYANDRQMQWALPVKLYDAVRFRLPMVVSSGSYAADYTRGLRGVLAVDPATEDAAERVAAWYQSLNAEAVQTDYEEMERGIFAEDLAFRREFLSFIQRTEEKE